MASPFSQWLRDLLHWVKHEEGDIERAARLLEEQCREGVTPPPPDTPATPLGGRSVES
jgi:hypothetical protein